MFVYLQDEDAIGQLHALGKVEGREGEQSLSVCFYLSDDSQAGNPAGMQRCDACTLSFILVSFAKYVSIGMLQTDTSFRNMR